MKIKSHCKINLFLHIIGTRADGYHELESLFYFPEVYDEIEIIEGANADKLQIDGRFGAELQNNKNENLILKTYSLLKILYGAKLPDLNFKLTKNIPIASGIGGGSANAATILKALNEKYELGLNSSQLYKIGARLGADVPACIMDRTCFARGIGEILADVGEFPDLFILLVNPLKPVSTKDIFKMGIGPAFTAPLNKQMSFKNTQNLIDFLETTHNDLEQNAKKLLPEINDIIGMIKFQSGCLLSRMSGSGATCFGIFETKDKALMAKENILKQNPNFWVQVG